MWDCISIELYDICKGFHLLTEILTALLFLWVFFILNDFHKTLKFFFTLFFITF